MEKILKHFNAIFNCEQFVITGSFAMNLMGLKTSVNDLDIILVNPSDETIKNLKSLEKTYPADTKSYFENMYIFKYDAVKVDIFIQTKKIDTKLTYKNMDVDTLDRIINEKKSYNRFKDWNQLRKVSTQFFTHAEFTNFLDNQL